MRGRKKKKSISLKKKKNLYQCKAHRQSDITEGEVKRETSPQCAPSIDFKMKEEVIFSSGARGQQRGFLFFFLRENAETGRGGDHPTQSWDRAALECFMIV